jgi:hypothetical protein
VKAIRAEMGPEWRPKREKPQTRVFYNFSAVEAEAKPKPKSAKGRAA